MYKIIWKLKHSYKINYPSRIMNLEEGKQECDRLNAEYKNYKPCLVDIDGYIAYDSLKIGTVRGMKYRSNLSFARYMVYTRKHKNNKTRLKIVHYGLEVLIYDVELFDSEIEATSDVVIRKHMDTTI